MKDWIPLAFIGELVEVQFDQPFFLEKKPPCPSAFAWRGDQYLIDELVSEWVDYQRRGRMARNMQPQHAAVASQRGSWGVGRFYFRVRARDRYFELYYDRAPKDSDARKGIWMLVGEYKTRM